MNDKQQPQKDENSEGGGTVPSYTDRILWSDCPEELYLKRILEEQEGHKFDGSGGKDSLMGDSTVENLLVSNRADGSVRSWQDWAPIARSIATKSAGNKSNNNGVGDEPAKPSPADTNLGIQPRFVNFEDDSSSTTTLPDRLFPESVNFDEEIAQIEQTGMSTITGDHGFVGIQPQIDYSSWWIYPGDGTYAKLQDECQPTSVAQATSGASSGTRIPHKNRDEQPLTPSTYNSNTTSDDREVDRKRCSFLGRAPRHTLFRRLIIAIVFFFLVFLLLSGIAMIRSKTVGTEQGSLGATSSIPTPATFTPFPNDSPAAPGSAPFNSPSDEITKPTGTPSFLVIPGPYKTQSPTKLPASYPTNMPHQDVVTKVPIMPQTNTPMPSGLTTTLDFATLVQFILDQSPGSSETLFDESSAQFKALQWVFSDVSRRPLPDYRILQRWVLGVLFYALGGDSWSRDDDWLTSTNECFWFTTSNDEICDERGRITIIELRDNSLEGTLPGELSLLSDSLAQIYMNSNTGIHGTLPASLGKLTKLKRLYFTVDSITGHIPSEIGLLSSLEHVGLGRNKFTGTLPSELSQIEGLRVLQLSLNELEGTIPSEFGRLSRLGYFSLASNKISGTIPSELGWLSRISELKLENNRLTGSMPEEICQLTVNILEDLLVDCDEVECLCCETCGW